MSQVEPPISLLERSRDSDLSQPEIFDILSNERRQCALHYLLNNGERPVDLRELVDYVAAWENDADEGTISGDARKRVYTALRQSHLPRMAEAGLIEYEHQLRSVELTGSAEDLRVYFEAGPSREIPWSMRYLALSAVSAALVAVTWAEIPPFDLVSGILVAAVIVAAFAISAAVHTYKMEHSRFDSDRFDVGGS